jgi:hypothetical protein
MSTPDLESTPLPSEGVPTSKSAPVESPADEITNDVDKKADDKKDERPKAPLFALFAFADGTDKLLMAFGTLAALGLGKLTVIALQCAHILRRRYCAAAGITANSTLFPLTDRHR